MRVYAVHDSFVNLAVIKMTVNKQEVAILLLIVGGLHFNLFLFIVGIVSLILKINSKLLVHFVEELSKYLDVYSEILNVELFAVYCIKSPFIHF